MHAARQFWRRFGHFAIRSPLLSSTRAGDRVFVYSERARALHCHCAALCMYTAQDYNLYSRGEELEERGEKRRRALRSLRLVRAIFASDSSDIRNRLAAPPS